jgi:hypothetical protein
MILLFLVLLYVSCVALFTGMYFAYWQRNWPDYGMPQRWFYENRTFSLAYGLFPFIGWTIVFFMSDFGRHGWLWPWSDKARKEAGIVK